MVIPATLLVLGASMTGLLLAFGLLSLREGAPRAARISILAGALTAVFFSAAVLAPPSLQRALLLGLLALGFLGVLIFAWPIGRVETGPDQRSERFDERDVVFARAQLVPGSPEHEAYYNMRPEKRAPDERLRAFAGLLSPQARLADPLIFPAAQASFDVTEALREAVDGPVSSPPVSSSPEGLTRLMKGLALHLGAHSVGVCRLQPSHIYSHIGRGTGRYGAPVDLNHRFALAFTVEMDFHIMGTAPQAPVVLESARRYVDAAVIAIQLANLARRLGYPARAHIDGNYRVIAPLVAREAGLGEIGRIGILMTPDLGPRVRLGVVTTDLPLLPDQRMPTESIIDFCRVCAKCAESCPSRAIPMDDRKLDHGMLRWKLDEDRCFRYWNAIGTDCGICMAVCPYSHPANWAHNLMRAAVACSGTARRAAVWLDDWLYGREPLPRQGPGWLGDRHPEQAC